MAYRVLHLLSQRPLLTGSGITLNALTRQAARAGWQQWAVVGTPSSDPRPAVAGLPADRVRPVVFETAELDFPLPGMSDVMPYESSRFSELSPDQLAAYRRTWRQHVARSCDEAKPDVIHAHHVWLASALLADAAPGIPVVNHCHATGLRQLELCPHLADEVRRGCRRNARFVVLHADHRAALQRSLGVDAERITVVGAGYRPDLFHRRGRPPRGASTGELIYVGKLSSAKGLGPLLDAFERLAVQQRACGGRAAGLESPLRLHVVGGGVGVEADRLRARMRRMGPLVVVHGPLDQAKLGGLLRRSAVCALPSFFEGLPLVLVEAIACGCRVVASAVPGVLRELLPNFEPTLEAVPLPRMQTVDTPIPEELPQFVAELSGALRRAMARPAWMASSAAVERQVEQGLRRFTWEAVFGRVEAVWHRAMV